MKVADGLFVKRFSERYADLYLRNLYRRDAEISIFPNLSTEDMDELYGIQEEINNFLTKRNEAIKRLSNKLLVLSSNGYTEEIIGEIGFGIMLGVKVFSIIHLPPYLGAQILDLLCSKYKDSAVRCFWSNYDYSVMEELQKNYGYRSVTFESNLFKKSEHLSYNQVYNITYSEEYIITKYDTGLMVRNLERMFIRPEGSMADVVKELSMQEFDYKSLKEFMDSKFSGKISEYSTYKGTSFEHGQYAPVYVGFSNFGLNDRESRTKQENKYVCAIYRGHVIAVIRLLVIKYSSGTYQCINMFDIHDLFLDKELSVLRYMMGNLYKFVYPNYPVCLSAYESKFEQSIDFNNNTKKFVKNLEVLDNPER